MNYENRYMDMKMISMRWFWYKRCVDKMLACACICARARAICMHLCTRVCYVITYTHTYESIPQHTRACVKLVIDIVFLHWY